MGRSLQNLTVKFWRKKATRSDGCAGDPPPSRNGLRSVIRGADGATHGAGSTGPPASDLRGLRGRANPPALTALQLSLRQQVADQSVQLVGGVELDAHGSRAAGEGVRVLEEGGLAESLQYRLQGRQPRPVQFQGVGAIACGQQLKPISLQRLSKQALEVSVVWGRRSRLPARQGRGERAHRPPPSDGSLPPDDAVLRAKAIQQAEVSPSQEATVQQGQQGLRHGRGPDVSLDDRCADAQGEYLADRG